jgi:hypothetical protein
MEGPLQSRAGCALSREYPAIETAAMVGVERARLGVRMGRDRA